MKLEKREITLNETDSIKDMLYMEKILLRVHEESVKKAERKEVEGVLHKMIEDTKKEIEALQKEKKNAESIKKM